jgi:hypothetical protein
MIWIEMRNVGKAADVSGVGDAVGLIGEEEAAEERQT